MPIARSETELSESLASQLPHLNVFTHQNAGAAVQLARDEARSFNRNVVPYPTNPRITKNKTEGPSRHPSAV